MAPKPSSKHKRKASAVHPSTNASKKARPRPPPPPAASSPAKNAPPSPRAPAPERASASAPASAPPAIAAPTSLSLAAHEPLLAELASKYDVLTASVISSTKIRSRVVRVLDHLRPSVARVPNGSIALLHARPADASKMITVAETVKREVAREGTKWYQYNYMFALPPREKGGGKGVKEAAKEKGNDDSDDDDDDDGDDDDDDDDDFEVMADRFEKAVMPPEPERVDMSLSIFLSLRAVPELKSKSSLTPQTNDEAAGSN